MHHTLLGNTGLRVSVAGLGCGGNARLGLGAGKSEAECIKLVRAALDLGVTFFDTAEAYGTEGILGQAIQPQERKGVVISTKSRIVTGDTPLTADDLAANIDASLQRLRTDYVDVFLLHGVPPSAYDRTLTVYAPVLQRAQTAGKIRHIGLSETSPRDPEQTMLQRALKDDVWRVYMLAFHMLNQGARRDVFPHTQKQGIGTLADVRRAQHFFSAQRFDRDVATVGGGWLGVSRSGEKRRSARLPPERRRRLQSDRCGLSLCPP